MDIKELTAKYIREDAERLGMALYVYEAMPTVRNYLIDDIFQAIGDRIAKRIGGVEVWPEGDQCVYFRTKEAGDYWVFAEPWVSKGISRLVAGIYATPIDDEHRERFKSVDLETWTDLGRSMPPKYADEPAAYVGPDHGGGRWDDGYFLKRAIRNRCEIITGVTEALLLIYKGMFMPQAG